MNPLKELKQLLYTIYKKGGPVEEDYYSLIQAFACAQKVKPKWSKAELLELFGEENLKDTYMGRLIHYPKKQGDYLSMKYLQEKEPLSQDPIKMAIDHCIYELPVSYAVRNRLNWFLKGLQDECEETFQDWYEDPDQPDTLHILDLACGTGKTAMVTALYQQERTFHDAQDHRIKYWGMDIDPCAVDYASLHYLKHNHTNMEIIFKKGSLFQKWEMDQPFHFIWCAGLFDYLNDAMFVKMGKKLLKHSVGSVMIGNLGPNHASKGLMTMCGWDIYHRTRESLQKLGEQICSEPYTFTVETDEIGVQHYLWFSSTWARNKAKFKTDPKYKACLHIEK